MALRINQDTGRSSRAEILSSFFSCSGLRRMDVMVKNGLGTLHAEAARYIFPGSSESGSRIRVQCLCPRGVSCQIQ